MPVLRWGSLLLPHAGTSEPSWPDAAQPDRSLQHHLPQKQVKKKYYITITNSSNIHGKKTLSCASAFQEKS